MLLLFFAMRLYLFFQENFLKEEVVTLRLIETHNSMKK